jgi:hypothetical protein
MNLARNRANSYFTTEFGRGLRRMEEEMFEEIEQLGEWRRVEEEMFEKIEQLGRNGRRKREMFDKIE